jgi:hypothetical protein
VQEDLEIALLSPYLFVTTLAIAWLNFKKNVSEQKLPHSMGRLLIETRR